MQICFLKPLLSPAFCSSLPSVLSSLHFFFFPSSSTSFPLEFLLKVISNTTAPVLHLQLTLALCWCPFPQATAFVFEDSLFVALSWSQVLLSVIPVSPCSHPIIFHFESHEGHPQFQLLEATAISLVPGPVSTISGTKELPHAYG